MDVVWNKKRILELLKSFYTIVPARVSLFGIDGEEIIAYPTESADYCNIITSTSMGAAQCALCDQSACQEAKGKRESYCYQCHAGLTEIIAPIFAYGDKPVGYLMIGQIRSKDKPCAKAQHIWQAIGGRPADAHKLESAYESLMVLEENKIAACVRILQACAASVWLDDYLRISNDSLSERIKLHILANLNKPISLAELTAYFQVGKTTLCQAVKSELGISVKQFDTNLRVEEAKKYLHTTGMTIAEVAAKVGIPDYNYFTKVFKRTVGVTPSAFRKRNNHTDC